MQISTKLEDLSEYTFNTFGWHARNMGSMQQELSDLKDVTLKLNERWTRSDEATRSFMATWFNTYKEDVDACFPTSSCLNNN
ncbi:hypothetical protein Bca4012_065343 [Brassica carinata]